MAGAGQQGSGEDQVGRRRDRQPDEPGQRLDRESDRAHREDVERAQPDDGEVVAGQPRPRDQLEQEGAGDRDHPQGEDPQQAEPGRPRDRTAGQGDPQHEAEPQQGAQPDEPSDPAGRAGRACLGDLLHRDGPVVRRRDRRDPVGDSVVELAVRARVDEHDVLRPAQVDQHGGHHGAVEDLGAGLVLDIGPGGIERRPRHRIGVVGERHRRHRRRGDQQRDPVQLAGVTAQADRRQDEPLADDDHQARHHRPATRGLLRCHTTPSDGRSGGASVPEVRWSGHGRLDALGARGASPTRNTLGLHGAEGKRAAARPFPPGSRSRRCSPVLHRPPGCTVDPGVRSGGMDCLVAARVLTS